MSQRPFRSAMYLPSRLTMGSLLNSISLPIPPRSELVTRSRTRTPSAMASKSGLGPPVTMVILVFDGATSLSLGLILAEGAVVAPAAGASGTTVQRTFGSSPARTGGAAKAASARRRATRREVVRQRGEFMGPDTPWGTSESGVGDRKRKEWARCTGNAELITSIYRHCGRLGERAKWQTAGGTMAVARAGSLAIILGSICPMHLRDARLRRRLPRPAG